MSGEPRATRGSPRHSGTELDWSEWQDVKEAIAALDGTAPAQQEKPHG